MESRNNRRAWLAEVKDMRAGRMPDSILLDSAECRQYLATMDKLRRDLEKAPPMTLAQKVRAATILWGGGNAP